MSHSKRCGFVKDTLVGLPLLGVVLLVAFAATHFTAYGEMDQQPTAQDAVADSQSGASRFRNLAFQPEAQKLARRLGKRFTQQVSTTSRMTGELTLTSERLPVAIVRSQLKNGESLELRLSGEPDLSWRVTDGASSNRAALTDRDRDLIERLVFDSPDYFINAQLRGAAYSTVATGVQSDEQASESVSTTWTIVRVDDPEQDEGKRAKSRWRLYYLNSNTGLIDRIIYDTQLGRVQAEFRRWSTDGARETFPSHIVWKRNGDVVMELAINNFTTLAAH